MQQWKRVSTKQMPQWQQLMQRLLETLLVKDQKGINLNGAQIAMSKIMTRTTVMDKEPDDKDEDNYTIMAVNNKYENDDDTPNLALVIMSGHDHDAYAVSKSASTIIDSGTSSHFSPDKNKFINYRKIITEPVKVTDGGFFSATGKGDLKIKLPDCPGHKPITITLKGVYYSPTTYSIHSNLSLLP